MAALLTRPVPARPAGTGAQGELQRRTLLTGLLAAAAAPLVACGGGGSASPMSAGSPASGGSAAAADLPILPLLPGVLDANGTRVYALIVQAGAMAFRAGVSTQTMGYNGALLGPALRLRRGEQVRIEVQNTLNEATTVHWHGLQVPAPADGGPHQSIAAGGRWSASFTVVNPASTCWFHPHGHRTTGRQVVSGLAGLLIVDDALTANAGLPGQWGVDDIALVLQDKRFDATGQIDYTLTATDLQQGYKGDVLLVNGSIVPVLKAPQQWLRLRLLNGCNARTLNLRLGNSQPVHQIANEGGLLGQPVTRSAVALSPGERAEVLVDLTSTPIGQEVALYASDASTGMGMGMGTSAAQSEVLAMTLRVDRGAQAGAITAVPPSLPAAAPISAAPTATKRSIRLDGGMMGSPFTLNGRTFDLTRIDITAGAGTTEVWTFTNATAMAHPMHVHGVRMSLLSRNGVAPAAAEQGLRDTFKVESMETVQLAVRMADEASATPLMFHCHILEHEDAGMMGQFITV